jgi:predicted Zn-dependent protease
MWYDRIGQVHLLQSRIEEAILWFERARSVNSKVPLFRLRLASAYALKGETERASVELAEARKLQGEGSFSSIARVVSPQVRGARPEIRDLYEATYYAGLRKVGMPEG